MDNSADRGRLGRRRVGDRATPRKERHRHLRRARAKLGLDAHRLHLSPVSKHVHVAEVLPALLRRLSDSIYTRRRAQPARRAVIGPAKGKLMEWHSITADQIFTLLRGASQRPNLKVVAIAESAATTGDFPIVDGPPATGNAGQRRTLWLSDQRSHRAISATGTGGRPEPN